MLYKVRRKLLSQNFLYSRTLISSLVRKSSIGKKDTVLEIGPGKGFITAELLKTSKRVIAVELDEKLILHLKQFLGSFPNLELYQEDFLKYQLPNFPYKVFANIPFSIEGEVIRKLLDSHNPPQDCYLIVDKRLAKRLSGAERENQFSLKHKPWFDFLIHYYFRRSDFIPEPNVEVVMWRITKKADSPVPMEERHQWSNFIELGFGSGLPVIQNLKILLTPEQLNSLSLKLNFSLKTRPGRLSFNQWMQIYNTYKKLKPMQSN